MDKWVSTASLSEMGLSSATIYRVLKKAKWRYQKSVGKRGKPRKEVLLSTLPVEIQIAFDQYKVKQQEKVQQVSSADYEDQQRIEGLGKSNDPLAALQSALLRYPLEERAAWLAEIQRLGCLIEKYDSIKPRRLLNPSTGKYEFVRAVLDICKETICTDPLILAREPRRAKALSPYTLDDWLLAYRKDGLAVFLHAQPIQKKASDDKRKAPISEAAIEWVNVQWRSYRSPRALYEATKKKAKKELSHAQ